MTFSFLPADIISQILNFGAPAPIEVQIRGPDLTGNFAYAERLLRRLRHVPGLADARIQQSLNAPSFNVDVDRTRAQYVGITERDVTNSMVVNLAGSSQVQPTFWLNPDNGVNYCDRDADAAISGRFAQRAAQPPHHRGGAPSQTLGAIADVKRTVTPAVYSQYDIQPMIQIYGTTQGRDLGAVAADVQRIVDETAARCRSTAHVVMLGQVKTMNSAFSGLIFGLIAAVVLIYLLIVVNFQSWADPFVIITALPAALAGIVWMLFATGTTLSVPALTGAIMCMGVATANSVLVVSFAKERLEAHRRRGRRRARSGLRAPAAGHHDGARHDYRHAADGARPRRRRRTERTARPRRDRWPDLCYRCDFDVRSGRLQHHSRSPREGGRPGVGRTACRLRLLRRGLSRRGLVHRRRFGADRRCLHRRHGHHHAPHGRCQAAGMDRGPGRPRGRRGAAGHTEQDDDSRPSRPARGLHPGADVCPRQRLCKEWKADIGTPVKAATFSPRSTRRTSTSRSCRPKQI